MTRNIILKKIYDNKIFFYISIFLFLLETLLVLISTVSIAPIVDYFNNENSFQYSKISNIFFKFGLSENIIVIVSFFLIVFSLSYILKIVSLYFVLKFKYLFLIDINKSLYQSIVSANWNFIKKEKSGDLINLIKTEIEKIGNIFMASAKFLSDSIQIFFLFVISTIINFKISIIITSILIVLSIPFFLLRRHTLKYGNLSVITGNFLTENLNNLIKNLKIIITNNLGDNYLSDYLKLYKQHSKAAVYSQTIIGGLPQLIYPLGIFAFILSMIILNLDKSLVTELTVIFFIFYRIIPLTSSLISSFNSIVNVIPSLNQLQKIYIQCIANKSKDFGPKFNFLNENINVKNLSYSHDDSKKLFENLNFTIKKNSIFGIVGSSGSGKSTLIDLITGNLKVQSGSICFDDLDISDFNLKNFRDKVSTIGQDVPLFNDTIINNLFIDKNELKTDRVIEILEITGLNKIINDLEHQYESFIGRGGILLSGGQIQRVAIARALIRSPNILILDEFTSSLDKDTETDFFNLISILKKKMTIIVITHSIEFHKYFDDHINLDKKN